jgi:hypothetical protein
MADPTRPKIMSRKDFASKLKAEIPDLKPFSDDEIVNQVLQLRPDLLDRIENPMAGDAQAAAAQARAQEASRHMQVIDPQSWQNHPYLRQIARTGLDVLPGLGAMAGGALATPETFGGGTIIGGALGAGAGRGLRDIAADFLGLNQTTPLQKATGIAGDVALTAAIPGAMQTARNPIWATKATAQNTARNLLRLKDIVTPRALRSYVTPAFLEDLAYGPKPPESSIPGMGADWSTSGRMNVGSRPTITVNPPPESRWAIPKEPYYYQSGGRTTPTEPTMNTRPDIDWRTTFGEPKDPASYYQGSSGPVINPPQTVSPSAPDIITEILEQERIRRMFPGKK